jgi:FtsH-binding integral membrane protein
VSRWPWFCAWALVGALLTFSFLTGLSIGLFVMPLGLVALAVVARKTPGRSETAGFLAGMGAIFLLVAVIQLDRDPVAWFAAGSAALLLAVVLYAYSSRRSAAGPFL